MFMIKPCHEIHRPANDVKRMAIVHPDVIPCVPRVSTTSSCSVVSTIIISNALLKNQCKIKFIIFIKSPFKLSLVYLLEDYTYKP